MGLEQYRQKRDFKSTSEPEGTVEKSKDALRFVVQRHQATHLHYDLRLEMDGVLKSWAVPKGPSMNPADKRLAIETEDHPVKYLYFEGTIAKGNYGAGAMNIWDHGTYRSLSENGNPVAGWHAGNLKFELKGKKLKGEFALVKTKTGGEDNQWLLIKKKDNYSTGLHYDAEDLMSNDMKDLVKEKAVQATTKAIDLNEMIKPMLATLTDKVEEKPGWIYEIKWDGYRALANIQEGRVHLYSRNGITFNSKFSPIAESLKCISHDAILDGEIVLLDEGGLPHFQELQNYQQGQDLELRYYVFDLLFLNGHGLMQLPLTERKSLIPDLIENVGNIYFCDHVEGRGRKFLRRLWGRGLKVLWPRRPTQFIFPGFDLISG